MITEFQYLVQFVSNFQTKYHFNKKGLDFQNQMSKKQQRLAFCPKIYAIENVHNSETLPSVNENYPFLREKLQSIYLLCS